MKTLQLPEDEVLNLKAFVEGNRLRLTFHWPPDVEQAYIFRRAASVDEADPFDIYTAEPKDARLFTLQEYKKQGGYIEPLPLGCYVYFVFPFVRKDGDDWAIFCLGNSIEVTEQIPIHFSIREKVGLLSRYKIHMVEILSQHDIKEDILSYVKKENGYPSDVNDGTIYFFSENLQANVPLRREIKTAKNEFIRIFVSDPDKAGLYLLRPM